MDATADLEIGLYRAPTGGYRVELRFTHPGGETELAPERGTAVFDLAELLSLHYDPEAYGLALAGGLFHDANVRSFYNSARAVTEAAGAALRVRLYVASTAARLQALRWELLRDPNSGSPVATSERVLFSRFMISRDWRPVVLRPRAGLKVLVAVAAPDDAEDFGVADVGVDGEVRRIRESLAVGNDNAPAIDVLGQDEPLTLERLAGRLDGTFDVVYMVCHGMLSRDQVSTVLLADENGHGVPIAGEKLADALGADRPPQLVVLASCESAGTEGRTRIDGERALAEASVTRLLAEAGVPAVVAMQGKISMRTTEIAMPVFFRELLRDGVVDRALAVARASVRDRYDAWMPALYSRLQRGCIWTRDAEEDNGSPAREDAAVSLRAPSRLKLPEQPYPVLLPYEHPDLFAGRERDLAELRRRLRIPIPILGLGAASGTGKSSLLRAGLLPALRAEGRPVAEIRHPQESGVAARLLGELVDSVNSYDDAPDGDWQGFVKHLSVIENLAGEPPLLVLDQFENVLRDENAEARVRLGVLLAATTRQRPGIDRPLCRWLLTYRIEYHGELLAWLENVLLDAPPSGLSSLPYDLSGPERFQGLILKPLATPSSDDDLPGGAPLTEAASVFQEVIEKPLQHYGLSFAPGHAERLAQTFAAARVARLRAPLVSELQVVLAHLVSTAVDGVIEVPEEATGLVDEALADHLRRALGNAFPSGSANAATGRARALLALRELAIASAAEAAGRREEGMLADDLARAISKDDPEGGLRILQQLATPLTRLVVPWNAPDGLRYVLSHDQMAAAIVRMVEKEGHHGKFLVDADLLALRRFVDVETALHQSQGSEDVAIRIPRRYYRRIEANTEALLWGDERRAWWTACQRQKQADGRRLTQAATAALLFLALLSGAIWMWVKERKLHQHLLDTVAQDIPVEAFGALDQLIRDSDTPDDVLLDLLRQHDGTMDVLEQGLGGIPDERQRNEIVLRTVRLVLPWVMKDSENPVLLANLAWSLDYGPARDSVTADEAKALREEVLGPLRQKRPPPTIAPDDPDWIDIPAGTFMMGSKEGEGGDNERPRHEVSVSAFRIMRHEVTNEDYRLFQPDHDGKARLPVGSISWHEAYTYAAWIRGRLPTEAEWEYMARSGCIYSYCDTSGREVDLYRVGWVPGNPRTKRSRDVLPFPVMELLANQHGIFDLFGNVSEWTANYYGAYTPNSKIDPWGPSISADGVDRISRGGSYKQGREEATFSYRKRYRSTSRFEHQGFRVAMRKNL